MVKLQQVEDSPPFRIILRRFLSLRTNAFSTLEVVSRCHSVYLHFAYLLVIWHRGTGHAKICTYMQAMHVMHVATCGSICVNNWQSCHNNEI